MSMATILYYAALLNYAVALPAFPSAPIANLTAGFCTAGCAEACTTPTFDTHYRSTISIIWSCVTVIFASSWLCVHPNITGYNKTTRQRLCERLKLFALAILAPEVLTVFAIYQARGCRTLYRRFKERAKELNLPLLLDSEASTLENSDTSNSSDDGTENHPCDEDEIPLLSRHRQGTYRWGTIKRFWTGMAFLFFKTLARVVWSHGKNPNKAIWTHTHAHFVQMGGIVFRDDNGKAGYKSPERWTDEDIKTFFAMRLSEAAISDKSKAGALAKTLVVARVLWFLIQVLARTAQELPIALLEVASLAYISFNFGMYMCWWSKPLDVEYPLEMPGIADQVRHVPKAGRDTVVDILFGVFDTVPIGLWSYSPHTQCYPRLYSFGDLVAHDNSPDTPESSRKPPDGTFRGAIVWTSAGFGVMHIIGTNLPSYVEFILWIVSTVILTVYPIIPICVNLVHAYFSKSIAPRFARYKLLNRLFKFISLLLWALGGFTYLVARFSIMFLPFIQLRDLPPLVHRTVPWSRLLASI